MAGGMFSEQRVKAFITFIIALFVGGFIYQFFAKFLPSSITGSQIANFLVSAIVVFAVYVWLVKKLKAPPE